ncbi:MAG: DoxX family protein [Flavobacteriales bacterium]
MESTTVPQIDAARQKNLNRLLWGMQVFLFLAFGAAGLLKLTLPIGTLTDLLTWPGAVPEYLVRAIGAAEIAGAMGVLLPALTRMQPWITSYAAMGLATVMICAVGYHLMLFQGKMLVPSIILGVIAGYVAWGRDKVVPIEPRA